MLDRIKRVNIRYSAKTLAALLHSIIACALLSGCAVSSRGAAEEFNQELFDQYEVVTGGNEKQALLTGFFLDREHAELAVVATDRDFSTKLQLFGLVGNAWKSIHQWDIVSSVLLVDVVNVGGRDRLIFYNGSEIIWIDPESGTEQRLLEIHANFQLADPESVPWIDITRDLNQDGLDDFVLPDFDGFWVSLQLNDGSFTEAVKLGPEEPYLDQIALDSRQTYRESGITERNIQSYLGRLYQADFNLDDLIDLVFWNSDRFEVYLQDSSRAFAITPQFFPTNVPFDSDGLYSHNFLLNDESMFSLVFGVRPRSKFTVLESLKDVNGDGLRDLVTQSFEGRSLLAVRAAYQVYFGQEVTGALEFSSPASLTLQPQENAVGGSPVGYSLGWLQDVNGDGQSDFLFGRVNTGVGGFLRALVMSSITIDLEYYSISDGLFPTRPGGTLAIRPDNDFFIGGRGPFFPTLLLADVNGDGLEDLLVGDNWDRLQIYLGAAGIEMFASQPHSISVEITANGEQDARAVNLNRDNKKDILVHHPIAQPPKAMLLIAR